MGSLRPDTAPPTRRAGSGGHGRAGAAGGAEALSGGIERALAAPAARRADAEGTGEREQAERGEDRERDERDAGDDLEHADRVAGGIARRPLAAGPCAALGLRAVAADRDADRRQVGAAPQRLEVAVEARDLAAYGAQARPQAVDMGFRRGLAQRSEQPTALGARVRQAVLDGGERPRDVGQVLAALGTRPSFESAANASSRRSVGIRSANVASPPSSRSSSTSWRRCPRSGRPCGSRRRRSTRAWRSGPAGRCRRCAAPCAGRDPARRAPERACGWRCPAPDPRSRPRMPVERPARHRAAEWRPHGRCRPIASPPPTRPSSPPARRPRAPARNPTRSHRCRSRRRGPRARRTAHRPRGTAPSAAGCAAPDARLSPGSPRRRGARGSPRSRAHLRRCGTDVGDEVFELAQVGIDAIAGERAVERVELADLLGSQGFTLAHGRPFSAW